MIDRNLIICALVSVAGHLALASGLDNGLPPVDRSEAPQRVTVRVVQPPPKPEEPPPPPPEPPKPPEPPPKPKIVEKKIAPKPTTQPPITTPTTEPPPQTPPLSSTSTTGDPNAKPKFGVSMESTSQGGKTSVPVGNTTSPTAPSTETGPPKPLPPAAAHEVTKMPLPQGRCAGKYTDAALAAAIEGVVVLDVIVDETGKTRDISVVEGLSHGLTEAAIEALKTCRFSAGERAGKPVPVRVRGFKIRFLLPDGGG
jgi:protein TonB